MGYKKIFIAVDCEDEKEQQKVQELAKELSGVLALKAKDLINFHPVLQKNKGLIYSAVNMISKEGKKGIFKLIPLLVKSL